MIDEYFETVGLTAGVLIILGVGLLICFLIAAAMESRTRQLFPDRKKRKGDDDIFDFGDDDEDDDDDDYDFNLDDDEDEEEEKKKEPEKKNGGEKKPADAKKDE